MSWDSLDRMETMLAKMSCDSLVRMETMLDFGLKQLIKKQLI